MSAWNMTSVAPVLVSGFEVSRRATPAHSPHGGENDRGERLVSGLWQTQGSEDGITEKAQRWRYSEGSAYSSAHSYYEIVLQTDRGTMLPIMD